MTKVQTAAHRCQIVLTFDIARPLSDSELVELVTTSDMAALILYTQQADETALQQRAAAIIRPIQAQGIAVLVAGDPRIGVRVGADGIHHEAPVVPAGISNSTHTMMIGYGNIRERHQAMEIGEAGADYIMFGKLGADKSPQPHPRNLRLATWWALMMEVPCLVQMGTDIEGLNTVAKTGAEFIAMEEVVFSAPNPHAVLATANQLLEKNVS